MNTELTKQDHENLATLVAIHSNKALSYRGACFNRAQAKRHEGFVNTLKKMQSLAIETREAVGKEG